MIASGTLEKNDLLRKGRKGEWTPAGDVEDLRDHWQSKAKQEPREPRKPRREGLMTRLSKWIDTKLEVGVDSPREFYQYPAAAIPKEHGLCSDRQCPCPEVQIPKGTGYLYISPEAVEFMRALKAGLIGDFVFGGPMPVLVCEQGAKLRGIDLTVAAADARRWWKTGKAPLRPTPRKRR